MPFHPTHLFPLCLVLCTLLSSAAGSRAQDAPAAPRDPWVERHRSEMNALQLKPDQQKKLDALLRDADARAAAIAKETEGSPRDRQAKSAAFRKETIPKLMAILTPEQKQALARYRSKRAAQLLVGAYRKALDNLELTEEQKPAAEKVLSESEPKLAAAISRLPMEGAVPRAMQKGLEDEIRQMRRDLNQVLTPEQQEQLRGMMGQE